MKVRFWGTCGSIPAPMNASAIRGKVLNALSAARGRRFDSLADLEDFVDSLPFATRATYGGNTSCVEISHGEHRVICDAGSGIRDLGVRMLSRKDGGAPKVFHIFLSHLHWDHIQGLPFFLPAYIPGNTIHIYGCHADIATAVSGQQDTPYFPVPFSALPAAVRFTVLTPGQDYELGGFRVRAVEQAHPGGSFGYAFSAAGRKVVYSTDSEHKADDRVQGPRFVEFFSAADLLVFDAQYSLAEADLSKKDWGHSSNVLGVELAVQARAKRLVLFHREPRSSDKALDQLLADTRQYVKLYAETSDLAVDQAYDGLEIEL